MSKGYSYTTFGAEVGCGKSTLYDWEGRHPEWVAAKKEAMARAKKFFETRLIAKIAGQEIAGANVKNIDTTCLIFALKTRFHETYGERQKVEQKVELTEKPAFQVVPFETDKPVQ
jgi:hypothetical protein